MGLVERLRDIQRFLHIKPELAKVVAEDDAATRYAKEGDVFDPTDIKPPTFLTAGKVIKNARKKDVQ